EKAGVGAGVNGTLAEFGNGLGVAVLGAVLNARFSALVPAAVGATSLPAALAAADGPAAREQIKDAFSSGLEVSQLAGAVAVLAGGLLAAFLLRRAERLEAAVAGPAGAAGTASGAPVAGAESPAPAGNGAAADQDDPSEQGDRLRKAGDRADSTGPAA
ncbi:MFS transporter, partial [Streptomyces griseus]